MKTIVKNFAENNEFNYPTTFIEEVKSIDDNETFSSEWVELSESEINALNNSQAQQKQELFYLYQEQQILNTTFLISNSQNTQDLYSDYNIIAKHLGLEKRFTYNQDKLIEKIEYIDTSNNQEILFIKEEKNYSDDIDPLYYWEYTNIYWYTKANTIGYSILDSIGKKRLK